MILLKLRRIVGFIDDIDNHCLLTTALRKGCIESLGSSYGKSIIDTGGIAFEVCCTPAGLLCFTRI